MGDLGGEANALENQGFLALDRGDFPLAEQCFDASLKIARKAKDLSAQCYAVGGTADLALSENRLGDTIALAGEAIDLGKKAVNSTGQLWSGHTLAEACLRTGDLAAAQSAIKAVRTQQDPMHQHFGYVLAGVISLRLGDRTAAGQDFDATLAETERLIKLCALNYKALTSAALAHAGLAVCRDNKSHVAAAREAFAASNAIVREPTSASDLFSTRSKPLTAVEFWPVYVMKPCSKRRSR